MKKEAQKDVIPLRLQAYERMTLFLERINPNKLLVRINPVGNNKDDYENLLIASIEQEFEHNLSQQIYLTEDCWSIINASKNATIQLIRQSNLLEKTDSADTLRQTILTTMIDKQAPSHAALSYIKEEMKEFI